MKIDFESSSEGVRIEIIPLIDVVFCILIFFILAALQLTRQQAINVELPGAGTATLQNQQMLMVSIDSIGRIYVDRSGVSESQLYLILEGYRRTNPLGVMVLYADRNAIYDDVVRVLDLMRSVGGDRVALATLSNKGGTSGIDGTFPSEFPSTFPQTAPTFPQTAPSTSQDPTSQNSTVFPQTAPSGSSSESRAGEIQPYLQPYLGPQPQSQFESGSQSQSSTSPTSP
jgi:biopolymer transport protein ExbD